MNFMLVDLYIMYLFVSGGFCLAGCPWDTSVLFCVAVCLFLIAIEYATILKYHDLYPFYSQWTFGLFPFGGYYEWCGYEHSWVSFCLDVHFQLSWVHGGITGSRGNYMFNSGRNSRFAFQSDCPIFHFLQEGMRVLIFPHPLQHSLLSSFLTLAILMKW